MQHFDNPGPEDQQPKLLEMLAQLPFCGSLSHHVHLQNLTDFKHR
jgi:hypothetical protein